MTIVAGRPARETDAPGAALAVVVALAVEQRALDRAGGDPGLALYRSGPGCQRAAEAAGLAIRAGARALLSFGLAGGLAYTARPGTVLLPRQLLRADRAPIMVDADWQQRLVDALAARFPVEQGALISVDRVLISPEEKSRTAADTGAVAADMESAAIAAAAAEAGIPFVATRVVADGPSDRLPDAIAGFVSAGGETRLGPLPGLLLAPKQLARLCLLGLRSRRAIRVLEALVQSLGERRFLCPPQPASTIETLH